MWSGSHIGSKKKKNPSKNKIVGLHQVLLKTVQGMYMDTTDTWNERHRTRLATYGSGAVASSPQTTNLGTHCPP